MSQRSKVRVPGGAGSSFRFGAVTAPSGLASRAEAQPDDRWQSLAICVLLALAVWAVFGQTLQHEFVNYDDEYYVYDNPAVVHGLNLNGVFWAFTHRVSSNWHPVTMLSHMLDCQLYGLNPAGHHLTNVLLHGTAAILLFFMLRNMTGALWRSAFVAAVFAIHPLRVESVAWVAERKDLLSGLFFVLTLWAYTRYASRNSKRAGSSQKPERKPSTTHLQPLTSFPYWTALIFFALGLMSKPMLVTLPFVLLLLDYWPLRRFSSPNSQPALPRLVWEKIPFLVLSAADCVATVLAQQRAMVSVHDISFPARVGNALVAYVSYLRQMLYPAGLAPFYPHLEDGLSVWKIGGSLLVLLIITAGVWAGRRKYPWLMVGWLWYLGMLVPVIGLLQVGGQAQADRYTYLPQIGLYILLAWGTVELCGTWRYRRVALVAAAGGILVGLIAAAHAQTAYWKDSFSLWTRAVACTADNYVAYNNLGNALTTEGKVKEAVLYYNRALELVPNYAEAHIGLGNALGAQRKLGEAIEHYQRALRIKPDSEVGHNDLGLALACQGKLDQAIEHYHRALQLNPDYATAHFNLANMLADQNRAAEAIQHYQRALQLKPDYPQAHFNLGNTLAGQGRLEEAIRHYEQALQLKPDYAKAENNLGNALATQGRIMEAIPHFRQALDLATAHNDAPLAEDIRAVLKSIPPALSQPATR